MKIDLACWERGCPCYDQNEGVDVVRREWVALTDEELNEIFWASLYRKDLAQAIEAKLKEKNT